MDEQPHHLLGFDIDMDEAANPIPVAQRVNVMVADDTGHTFGRTSLVPCIDDLRRVRSSAVDFGGSDHDVE